MAGGRTVVTLGRALLASLLVHLAIVGVAGTALRGVFQGPTPAEDPAQDAALHFLLVDAAVPELGTADAPPPGEPGESDAPAPPRGVAVPLPESSAVDPAAAPLSEPSAVDAATAAPAGPGTPSLATPVGSAADSRSVAPGRLSPRRLAERLGLQAEGLDDDALRGMFSAMHKYALQAPRPAASTYRQLLRAWIDGLMGYPYPVLEDLARNRGRPFIGGIRIEVAADGTARLAELWIHSDVADAEGRLAAYYERVIRAATANPFLPPADAGLPAPHGLEYRIVNPTASR